MKERKVLAHAPVREADIFWEKRVWRIINVNEKMNKTFVYPKAPLFDIIKEAAFQEKITLYSPETDDFSYQLDNINDVLTKTDTVELIDENYNTTLQVIADTIFYENVKRYRIKEVWFFDEATSSLKVRILGIAPLIEVYDDNGNFRFERPLFWAYFPELREVLAREEVFNANNDRGQMSWDDLFEMRYFASTIYKASNILDARLEEYYSGVDRLLEADKIKQEIFNFEHDLWSY